MDTATYNLTACDYCGAAAGVPCTTASGRPAINPHAARKKAAEETATQMVIEYHAEAREEDGTVYATAREGDNAVEVTETANGWEVFCPHRGLRQVSADFRTVTRYGREVSPEFMEHAHAIPAAKAGAKAIRAHSDAQPTEERHEKAVETAAHFAEARPQDAEGEGDQTTQTTNKPERNIMQNTTRHNGTRSDHLGFTKDYYTTTHQGVTYEVRRSAHPVHGISFVVKGTNDYGETYSVHHGTDHGKSVIAKVQADTAA